MNKPYFKLMMKTAAVAMILLLICRVRQNDEFVIAGELATVIMSSEHVKDIRIGKVKVAAAEEEIIAVSSNPVPASEPEEGGDKPETEAAQAADGQVEIETAEEINEQPETEVTEKTDVQPETQEPEEGGDKPETEAAQAADGQVEIETAEEINEQPETEVTEKTDVQPETQEPEEGRDKPETEAAQAADEQVEIETAEDSKQQYVNSLLVTGYKYYDFETVREALSVPTQSNDDRYIYITGEPYKQYFVGKMPKGYRTSAEAKERMVTIDVPVWKMDKQGNKYSDVWELTINSKLEAGVRCIFSEIYQLDIQFPFNYLKGFMYRKVGGVGLVDSKLMSAHSFGVAIDINYYDDDNDYFLGKGNDLRNKDNPYCIPDEVIDIFAKYGWFWGGDFEICSDTMHFQYFGLDFLQYDSDEPFPVLSYGAKGMDKKVISNLTARLVKLGHLSKESSSFSKKVRDAVIGFQNENGLTADGVVNYDTWELLINMTHEMRYVF